MEKLISELNHLVELLAQKKYAQIVQSGENGRLTAEEIERGIAEYSYDGDSVLVTPNNIKEEDLNIIFYSGYDTTGSVEYELWILGEMSDLTLSCDFDLSRKPILKIHNIHVM